MAISSILRRSASQLVPVAVRLISNQRHIHHCATIVSAVNRSDLSRELCRSSFPSVRWYSTKQHGSDESLIRVIESEIQCAQESDENNQIEEVPQSFPFKIDDCPGMQTISLTRDYQGETIVVEVHMPDLVTGENDEDDEDKDSDDRDKGIESHIPLVVKVLKKDGPCLEFGVTAYADEIDIERLSVKDPKNDEGPNIAYDGPEFSDLDENLQKAFHKYLEIRGIKPSVTNFLHEYMINKDSREYLMWLKNLKSFIEA